MLPCESDGGARSSSAFPEPHADVASLLPTAILAADDDVFDDVSSRARCQFKGCNQPSG